MRQPYLKFIQQGHKTVEGRINTGIMTGFRAGDRILCFDRKDQVLVEVVRVEKFTSFRDMLTAAGVSACLPEYSDMDKAVALYRSFPGYADKERRFGVLGIHIRVVGKSPSS